VSVWRQVVHPWVTEYLAEFRLVSDKQKVPLEFEFFVAVQPHDEDDVTFTLLGPVKTFQMPIHRFFLKEFA